MTKPLFALILCLALCSQAFASVLFSVTNEGFTVDQQPPVPPYHHPNLCENCTSLIKTASQSFLGTKYYQHYIYAGSDESLMYQQNNDGNYGTPAWSEGSPVNLSTSTLYYMAFLVNMTRVGETDIWRSNNSANKGCGLEGTGLRAGVGFGYWAKETYQANKYTIILKCNYGSTFDNGDSGCYSDNNYCQNQNGYTRTANYYMDYERWYSVVFAIQPHTSGGGKIRYWVNGTLIASYDDVTTATGTPNLAYVENFGTLCQNAYDCPAHYENFDRLTITDSLSDIDGTGGTFNFFADPEASSTTTSMQGVTMTGGTLR